MRTWVWSLESTISWRGSLGRWARWEHLLSVMRIWVQILVKKARTWLPVSLELWGGNRISSTLASLAPNSKFVDQWQPLSWGSLSHQRQLPPSTGLCVYVCEHMRCPLACDGSWHWEIMSARSGELWLGSLALMGLPRPLSQQPRYQKNRLSAPEKWQPRLTSGHHNHIHDTQKNVKDVYDPLQIVLESVG